MQPLGTLLAHWCYLHLLGWMSWMSVVGVVSSFCFIYTVGVGMEGVLSLGVEVYQCVHPSCLHPLQCCTTGGYPLIFVTN